MLHCGRVKSVCWHEIAICRVDARHYKPGNFLLRQNSDGSGCLKLADFRDSAVMRPDERLAEHAGSVGYGAPEAMQYAPNYSFKANIWSPGVILYEMLFGLVPFRDNGGQTPGAGFAWSH